jgi:hypothetical protein
MYVSMYVYMYVCDVKWFADTKAYDQLDFAAGVMAKVWSVVCADLPQINIACHMSCMRTEKLVTSMELEQTLAAFNQAKAWRLEAHIFNPGGGVTSFTPEGQALWAVQHSLF